MEYKNGWYEHAEDAPAGTSKVVTPPPVQRAPAMYVKGTGAKVEATCSLKADIDAGTATWFVLLDLGLGTGGPVTNTVIYRAYRLTAGASAPARLELTIAWPS